jgi:mannose-1-phosphate guanylyltransferase
MMHRSTIGDVWAIVLAGGEGKRMCPFVQKWLGQERPKQYCSFYGSKSLLGHTLDRAARLVGEERVVTVIGKGHTAFLRGERELPGQILEQSDSRGTGPGVLFPLSYIRARDADAVVVILPSDHFVHPQRLFFERIMGAVELLDSHSDHLILIAAVPQGPECEYGWIEPVAKEGCVSDPIRIPAQQVRKFVEKPSSREARHCFECGHFWSTMIVVARAESLWSLVTQLQPSVMSRFEKLSQAFRGVADRRFSEQARDLLVKIAYSKIPSFDFSKDVLTPSVEKCLFVPLDGVTWSDLGRPERLLEVLDRIGLAPNFPRELVLAGGRK